MGQRQTKVRPFTGSGVSDLHSSEPPRPSHDGGAGRGGAEDAEEDERMEPPQTKTRTTWWKRLTACFRATRKPSTESSSCQQQQPGTSTSRVARAESSSDDYILSRYDVGDELGRGGFGVVYEGTRLDDGLEVALKYVTKTPRLDCMLIPDHPMPLPREIALTILANKGPSVPQIIRLLDWQDHPDHFVMILERPSPCQTLEECLRSHGGCLDEETTRHIMWQVALAANECCARGVFHRDIKLQNILLNPETSQIKIIDFECGDILRWSSYRSYSGTMRYAPPEYRVRGKYYCRPATTWSLGVLMFRMLNGHFPSDHDLLLLRYKRWSKPGLSKQCCKLLVALLEINQRRRLGLGEIPYHKWFKVVGVSHAAWRLAG